MAEIPAVASKAAGIESPGPETPKPALTPRMFFSWKAERTVDFLIAREWLATNGLGGYASGTLLGVPTRRYHGAFVPNLPAPLGRTVIVPLVEDEMEADGRRFAFSGTETTDGRIDPAVHEHLRHFRWEWQRPIWLFEAAGRLLERTIVMPNGQNTTYCFYRLVSGEPAVLTLRPYISFRGHDEPLQRASSVDESVVVTRGRCEIRFPGQEMALRLAVRPERAVLVLEEKLRKNVHYRTEETRGYDSTSDLSSPGYFRAPISEGESVAFIMSTDAWENLDVDPNPILEAESTRLERNLALAPELGRTREGALLALAADQFITFPGTRARESVIATVTGEAARTVIAGYHWFTDWGRDTMISLEGLCLCTGRYQEAREILKTFANYVKDGLLPNHFPEGEHEAIYNTVDATFWYFHAIDRYLVATKDPEILGLLFPVLEGIIEHHVKGTRFGIGMDPNDGLIHEGAEGYALTWMDAKVGDWVVTPRRGKPVEIQALWYNALRLMEAWAATLGKPAGRYREMAGRAYDSFNRRFWYEAGGYLYDIVDGENGDDASLRPNQIFAVSLPHPVLDPERWRAVVDCVDAKLRTPVGLRTLDPADPDFQARYYGDRRARDAAYHQGTVWPWLLGPFLDAYRRIYPEAAAEPAILHGILGHMRDACVGTISEIHDAEFPYAPRGCVAQAWSVAELIRCISRARGWLLEDREEGDGNFTEDAGGI